MVAHHRGFRVPTAAEPPKNRPLKTGGAGVDTSSSSLQSGEATHDWSPWRRLPLTNSGFSTHSAKPSNPPGVHTPPGEPEGFDAPGAGPRGTPRAPAGILAG